MTNNLKEEIEENLRILALVTRKITERVEGGRYSEEEGTLLVKEEVQVALRRIEPLINQKEKEARIDELEKFLDHCYEAFDPASHARANTVPELRDRIKQLKEELNKKGK